ncbi:glycoside hydrolase family 36 protein [Actinomadura scrupuli]|uniref:glycoside hydrolase family 36 protein n=1 Tax=Actinomadura scrupuli TaxID=559629 RepID=UPI003D995D92
MVDPDRGRVYEHGWQSWSPSATYPVTGTGHRPSQAVLGTMCYRPGRPAPARGFQGEGLLAVDPGTGEAVRLFTPVDGLTEIPSIRAVLTGERRLVITADGPVEQSSHEGSLGESLAGWADRFAARAGTSPPRPAPTAWCSWYHYFGDVTGPDVIENLEAIATLDLPVDVVQIDDGWQAEIGDWTARSDRFGDLTGLCARVRDAGRRPGIWIAPFLVGARSELARTRPAWLVGGADAGHNWGQDLYALDTTHPAAAAYLRDVFARLRSYGFDYFKADFLYAGALEGRRHAGHVQAVTAYRQGLALIREAIGPHSHLIGSGAPILPSVGLVDAMRVSPDIGLRYEPESGDFSRPSQHAATLTTIGRAWQHGRFWVNDPDCLIVRPEVERREEWAATMENYGGLRVSSDRIAELDGWGLETTRRLLGTPPPPVPFDALRQEPG